jgi:hypothetical protein
MVLDKIFRLSSQKILSDVSGFGRELSAFFSLKSGTVSVIILFTYIVNYSNYHDPDPKGLKEGQAKCLKSYTF